MALELKEYGKFTSKTGKFYGKMEDASKSISIKRSDNAAPNGYFPIQYLNSKPEVPDGYVLRYKFIQQNDSITKEYCLVKADQDLAVLNIKDYENAVQDFLNASVQERGYDDVYTCLSYKDDPYQKFRDEASACLAWRSQVWLTAQSILNSWQNGEIEQPTIEDVLNQLPTLEW